MKNLVISIKASSLKHGFVMISQNDIRKKGLPSNTPYNLCHLLAVNYKDGECIKILTDEKYKLQR